MKAEHTSALDSSSWNCTPTAIYEEESVRLSNALSGSIEDFHLLFPGKVFLKQAADAVGLEPRAYLELICAALTATLTSHWQS